MTSLSTAATHDTAHLTEVSPQFEGIKQGEGASAKSQSNFNVHSVRDIDEGSNADGGEE